MLTNFEDLYFQKEEIVSYNLYAFSFDDLKQEELTLDENCQVLSNIENFDFAAGFAASMLSYLDVATTFITQVKTHFNWQDGSSDYEEFIVWSGNSKKNSNDPMDKDISLEPENEGNAS